jgi:site-specific recombinase XerD
MASRFVLDRYHQLDSATHAKEWLIMREQFGLAPNSLDAYARALDSYFSFMESRKTVCEQSTRADVACWINELRSRGLANATLVQRVTALRLFFEYLVEEGLRPSNPVFRGGAIRCYGSAVFRTAGPVRRIHKLPWIPTDEEWKRALHAIETDCIRDRAMFALAYDGALRREELCSVAVADFDFARKLLTVRAETTKNKCGKVVPYSWTTSALICRYLNRRHTMRSTPDAVFLSESPRNRSQPITPYTWTKVVERIAKRSDLPRLTTHTMRHLRLTDLARAGLDMHEIATLAGHRVLQSTLIYIHLSARDLTASLARTMAGMAAPRYPSLHVKDDQDDRLTYCEAGAASLQSRSL